MPCAVAIPNSPIFSSSSRILSKFCKSSTSPCSSSPRIHGPPPQSPPSTLTSPSPSSPLLLRIHKHVNTKKEGGFSLLKRKRPLMGTQSGLGLQMMPCGEERLDVVEVEEEGYLVYSKRGRRGCAMEDRYSASVGLNRDSR